MKIELARSISRLKHLMPKFRQVQVAVLGDLMLDRYLWGEARRLSPEAPVPVVDFESENDFPGGAGNVAVNLGALGAQVRLFGVIGGKTSAQNEISDDEAGWALRVCLRRHHIKDRTVLADAQRITTVKTRIIARHQQIVRVDRERRDALSRESEEKLFRLLVASLKTTDALVLSDYAKGLMSDGFAERILNACHKFDVSVFVKPHPQRLFAYRGAHAVIFNTKEAETYLSRSLSDEKSVEEAIRALLSQFGSAAVVLTRGNKGMRIFEEDAPHSVNIPATSFEVTYARVGQPGIERGASGRQVFDVTGAGDTVLSVLALARAAGANLPEAAYLANTAAGVVVGKLGTASVTPEELAAALDEIRD